MLRPACLLPVARPSPPYGLLTPRLDEEVSLSRLGSATRRTDAYRFGSFTRWKSAARFRLGSHRIGFFTAHHARSLTEPCR